MKECDKLYTNFKDTKNCDYKTKVDYSKNKRTVDVVRVYDMSGRLVYRDRKIKQLDLASHPSGQYLVEVRVGKERGRYTVIRE